MLKSIRKQTQANKGVIELDSINEQIQFLNNLVHSKKVFDKEAEDIMEEAKKVVEVLNNYHNYIVVLLSKIDYLKKDPTMKNFPGLYQDLELREQKVELVYDQLVNLEDEAKALVNMLQ